MTYAAPLKAMLRLIVWEQPEVPEEEAQEEAQEEAALDSYRGP